MECSVVSQFNENTIFIRIYKPFSFSNSLIYGPLIPKLLASPFLHCNLIYHFLKFVLMYRKGVIIRKISCKNLLWNLSTILTIGFTLGSITSFLWLSLWVDHVFICMFITHIFVSVTLVKWMKDPQFMKNPRFF